MKNIIIASFVLLIVVLFIFKTSSLASPMNPPAQAPGPSALVAPKNNQKWYFINAGQLCPDGYSSTPSPTICKLNNS